MHELSAAQIAYINREKRKNVRIFVSRILILILFFAFWELSADTRLIDSFIFSSPHRLIQCFFSMLKQQDLLFHIGITGCHYGFWTDGCNGISVSEADIKATCR